MAYVVVCGAMVYGLGFGDLKILGHLEIAEPPRRGNKD